MAFSTHTAGPERGNVVGTSIALLAWVGTRAKAALKALQMARMLSTLANMTDYQLAQIGISRSEIPEYAEKLMADE
ncbi:protein of unknown function [Aliiroseovarius sediminilitoris]|uniref:DUF1127 domain-containing protein n=1 Tax=Aliiroseovarius sediminilitoris TaxID=1173584 RepID=A0A1I0NT41_9RHOB|nr:DUF1127 domain-containing protein [Aliiroseovarius sediminilitoris]SEW04766.1 protein of unknown function [Aliiroseovarius sediminilitoris]